MRLLEALPGKDSRILDKATLLKAGFSLRDIQNYSTYIDELRYIREAEARIVKRKEKLDNLYAGKKDKFIDATVNLANGEKSVWVKLKNFFQVVTYVTTKRKAVLNSIETVVQALHKHDVLGKILEEHNIDLVAYLNGLEAAEQTMNVKVQNISLVNESVLKEGFFKDIWTSITEAFENLKNFFLKLFANQKTILQKLDRAAVEAGYRSFDDCIRGLAKEMSFQESAMSSSNFLKYLKTNHGVRGVSLKGFYESDEMSFSNKPLTLMSTNGVSLRVLVTGKMFKEFSGSDISQVILKLTPRGKILTVFVEPAEGPVTIEGFVETVDFDPGY